MVWNKTSESRKRTSNRPTSISQRRRGARGFGDRGSSGDWVSARATGGGWVGWSGLIRLAGPTGSLSKDNSLDSRELPLDAPQRINRARQKVKTDVFMVELNMAYNIICERRSI